MKSLLKAFFLLSVSLLYVGCSLPKAEHDRSEKRVVTIDSVFDEMFMPSGNGFTGGDGTYSVVLPDGRTVWIFGDTFIGNVTPDYKRIKTTPTYIRNSFVTFEDDSLITHQQGPPEEFKSMMIPKEVTDGSSGLTEHQLWFWPGDAFIENEKLNVFASKFFQPENDDDMWAFKFKGTELLEFSLPDMTLERIDKFSDLDSIHFGHCVFESSDFIYIYGLKKGQPYAARAAVGNVRGPWEFFSTSGWKPSAIDATPMMEFEGSEQFSVFAWQGKHILLMQAGDLSRKIYSFTSDSPVGPWSNQQLLYETPIPENCTSCWTYNALAHAQFTVDGLLLVSYNTNSMQFEDHYNNALIYRPRFIRIPFEMILSP